MIVANVVSACRVYCCAARRTFSVALLSDPLGRPAGMNIS
jgi:hypothetical protein